MNRFMWEFDCSFLELCVVEGRSCNEICHQSLCMCGDFIWVGYNGFELEIGRAHV